MTNVAIISTTINDCPASYLEWAREGDLIVAGDKKTPDATKKYVKEVGGEYLTPLDQDRIDPIVSDVIGWNCIQRRNMALLYAMKNDKYKYIVTVDDDNYPTENFVGGHVEKIEQGAVIGLTSQQSDWVNIGDFVTPPTNQRGHPLGYAHNYTTMKYEYPQLVVASQAQVLGSPDVDAVTRIVHDPEVTSVRQNVYISPMRWVPFNSQATVWRREWAPLMACLPGVGRYDDIWANLIAIRIMRAHNAFLYAGEPAVTQRRNEHDLMKDLKNEMYGYDRTFVFVEFLGGTSLQPPRSNQLHTAYRICIAGVSHLLPVPTTRFAYAWADAWEGIEQ